MNERNIVLENVFTPDEVKDIRAAIDHELSTRKVVEWDDAVDSNWHQWPIIRIKRNNLGRLDINEVPMPSSIVDKVVKIAQENSQIDSEVKSLISVTYAEYNLKYGQPKLEVHKDNDPVRTEPDPEGPEGIYMPPPGAAGVVLTYQLESNISWQVGNNKELYTIPDNGLLMLYPRRDYHWRAVRDWKEGEFVRVLFFEMLTPNLPPVVEDKEFEREVRDFRAHLGGNNENR
jgi:hypothetical protein